MFAITFLAAFAFQQSWPRLIGAPGDLNEQIEDADYIVIAALDKKNDEAFMDGILKYDFRFIHWIKSSTPIPKSLMALPGTVDKEVKSLPLYKYDFSSSSQAVYFGEEQEKSYHRLTESSLQQQAEIDVPPGERIIQKTYYLLFLCKTEDGKAYQTIGSTNAIMPVSPLLDVCKLPAGSTIQAEDLGYVYAAQSKVKMTPKETITFILKDYLDFKKAELARIEKDIAGFLNEKQQEKK